MRRPGPRGAASGICCAAVFPCTFVLACLLDLAKGSGPRALGGARTRSPVSSRRAGRSGCPSDARGSSSDVTQTSQSRARSVLPLKSACLPVQLKKSYRNSVAFLHQHRAPSAACSDVYSTGLAASKSCCTVIPIVYSVSDNQSPPTCYVTSLSRRVLQCLKFPTGNSLQAFWRQVPVACRA